jgi:hypothetical protein
MGYSRRIKTLNNIQQSILVGSSVILCGALVYDCIFLNQQEADADSVVVLSKSPAEKTVAYSSDLLDMSLINPVDTDYFIEIERHPIVVEEPTIDDTVYSVDAGAVDNYNAYAATDTYDYSYTTTESIQETTPAAPATPSLYPGSINILGEINSVIEYQGASSAPASSVGVWRGSLSCTDGSWGYLIGHNPGIFWNVINLGVGNTITVCDYSGNIQTYMVTTAFDMPNTTKMGWDNCNLYNVNDELVYTNPNSGEQVVLQTCNGNYNIRIVYCVAI